MNDLIFRSPLPLPSLLGHRCRPTLNASLLRSYSPSDLPSFFLALPSCLHSHMRCSFVPRRNPPPSSKHPDSCTSPPPPVVILDLQRLNNMGHLPAFKPGDFPFLKNRPSFPSSLSSQDSLSRRASGGSIFPRFSPRKSPRFLNASLLLYHFPDVSLYSIVFRRLLSLSPMRSRKTFLSFERICRGILYLFSLMKLSLRYIGHLFFSSAVSQSTFTRGVFNLPLSSLILRGARLDPFFCSSLEIIL